MRSTRKNPAMTRGENHDGARFGLLARRPDPGRLPNQVFRPRLRSDPRGRRDSWQALNDGGASGESRRIAFGPCGRGCRDQDLRRSAADTSGILAGTPCPPDSMKDEWLGREESNLRSLINRARTWVERKLLSVLQLTDLTNGCLRSDSVASIAPRCPDCTQGRGWLSPMWHHRPASCDTTGCRTESGGTGRERHGIVPVRFMRSSLWATVWTGRRSR
jgi:hypothetical protein